jgi:hypothetical protein
MGGLMGSQVQPELHWSFIVHFMAFLRRNEALERRYGLGVSTGDVQRYHKPQRPSLAVVGASSIGVGAEIRLYAPF